MTSQGLEHQRKGVHFFKIILETSLQQGKLRIPKSFAKRYWQGITNPVSLILPNKTERKVSWRKSDGDVWLTDGWKEFVENVSLQASYFVVFQYEENSRFNVIVFKESGLEIQYPLTETRVEPEEEKAGDEESFSVMVIDDSSSSQQGTNQKRKSSFPSSQIRKKSKTTSRREQKIYTGGKGIDMKEKIKNHLENVKKCFLTENEMVFFLCPIHKTYTQRDLLIIPNEFSKKHLEDMDRGKATLFVDNKEDKNWDVEFKLNTSKQLTFANGWRKFLMDNNLKHGDVCAFMLVKSKSKEHCSFKVVHYPQGKETSTSLPQERVRDSFKSSSSSEAGSRIISKYEAEIKVKVPNHIQGLPFEYIRSFVSESGKFATLRVGAKSWQVKLLFYPENSCCRFSQGWSIFVADFDLKTGDSIRLKIIDEENLEFRATILRLNSGKN